MVEYLKLIGISTSLGIGLVAGSWLALFAVAAAVAGLSQLIGG